MKDANLSVYDPCRHGPDSGLILLGKSIHDRVLYAGQISISTGVFSTSVYLQEKPEKSSHVRDAI